MEYLKQMGQTLKSLVPCRLNRIFSSIYIQQMFDRKQED